MSYHYDLFKYVHALYYVQHFTMYSTSYRFSCSDKDLFHAGVVPKPFPPVFDYLRYTVVCKSLVSKSTVVIQHWPIRTIKNDITSILIGPSSDFQVLFADKWLANHGTASHQGMAWKWGYWRLMTVQYIYNLLVPGSPCTYSVLSETVLVGAWGQSCMCALGVEI